MESEEKNSDVNKPTLEKSSNQVNEDIAISVEKSLGVDKLAESHSVERSVQSTISGPSESNKDLASSCDNSVKLSDIESESNSLIQLMENEKVIPIEEEKDDDLKDADPPRSKPPPIDEVKIQSDADLGADFLVTAQDSQEALKTVSIKALVVTAKSPTHEAESVESSDVTEKLATSEMAAEKSPTDETESMVSSDITEKMPTSEMDVSDVTEKSPTHETESMVSSDATEKMPNYEMESFNVPDATEKSPTHERELSKSSGGTEKMLTEGESLDDQDATEKSPIHQTDSIESSSVTEKMPTEVESLDVPDATEKSPTHETESIVSSDVTEKVSTEVESLYVPDATEKSPIHETESSGVTEKMLTEGESLDDQNATEKSPIHQTDSNESSSVTEKMPTEVESLDVPDATEKSPISETKLIESSGVTEKMPTEVESLDVPDATEKSPISETKSIESSGVTEKMPTEVESLDVPDATEKSQIHETKSIESSGVTEKLPTKMKSLDVVDVAEKSPVHDADSTETSDIIEKSLSVSQTNVEDDKPNPLEKTKNGETPAENQLTDCEIVEVNEQYSSAVGEDSPESSLQPNSDPLTEKSCKPDELARNTPSPSEQTVIGKKDENVLSTCEDTSTPHQSENMEIGDFTDTIENVKVTGTLESTDTMDVDDNTERVETADNVESTDNMDVSDDIVIIEDMEVTDNSKEINSTEKAINTAESRKGLGASNVVSQAIHEILNESENTLQEVDKILKDCGGLKNKFQEDEIPKDWENDVICISDVHSEANITISLEQQVEPSSDNVKENVEKKDNESVSQTKVSINDPEERSSNANKGKPSHLATDETSPDIICIDLESQLSSNDGTKNTENDVPDGNEVISLSDTEEPSNETSAETEHTTASNDGDKIVEDMAKADVGTHVLSGDEKMDSPRNEDEDPLHEKAKETDVQDNGETETNETMDTETQGREDVGNNNECDSAPEQSEVSEKKPEEESNEGREVAEVSEAKSTASDDDVCIIPDTEPRSDKEQAVQAEQNKSKPFAPLKLTLNRLLVPSSFLQKESGSDKDGNNAEKESNVQSETDTQSVIEAQPASDAQSDVDNRASTKDSETINVYPGASNKKSGQSSKGKVKITALLERRKETAVVLIPVNERESQTCAICSEITTCSHKASANGSVHYFCKDECVEEFKKTGVYPSAPTVVSSEGQHDFVHKCGECTSLINTKDERTLTWETMDFCNEDCLGRFQKTLGSHCANCKNSVDSASLGKYCVRFGHDIRQFCKATCLEEFKKGLKVCSYCQKDISSGPEGFLAPVGDKGQFKDFCTQACMEKYDCMSNKTSPPPISHECAVCNNVKLVEVQLLVDSGVQQLCSQPCFNAYKFVNGIDADQCSMCKKYFDKSATEKFTVFYDNTSHSFCCKTCMNVYILAKRKIVPCSWCKVKKYNFDMIKKVSSAGQALMMCSLNCLALYRVSISAVSFKRVKCDNCNGCYQAQYHLTMSDATIRNFCGYNCVMAFQGKFSNTPITLPDLSKGPFPTGAPKKSAPPRRNVPMVGAKENESASNNIGKESALPVISSVTSLAATNGDAASTSAVVASQQPTETEPSKLLYKQQLIIKPPKPPERKNKIVQVKPVMLSKSVGCGSEHDEKETQTDDGISGKPVLIPVPVPIYIPMPMHMYSSPYPVPVPFALPIPVPIFIPTTRNSTKGILKEIKRIQEKIPTDPFEAEMLMMAEIVAGDKNPVNTDSEDDDTECDAVENDSPAAAPEDDFTPETADASNGACDDVLQILKMASELDEPAVDFEAEVAPATITPALPPPQSEANDESEIEELEPDVRATRASRKRGIKTSSKPPPVAPKRGRRSSSSDKSAIPSKEREPVAKTLPAKPDANMCLKFTFGVNAWRHWVAKKNSDLDTTVNPTRKLKPFKPEILQLTADELNYCLCLFVKEVRKPNGSEYAPDTIYYLCLGIQQYLIENGRVENIFSDPYYEKFTECLDEVAKKFSVLYNDAQYIVTRVEEEHLWESKQLGAHSPYVLLSTLMFFNTKFFNLTTVDEHLQLSFSHIMKHWKKHPNSTGAAKTPGSRNVLLRFYTPQAALVSNPKKKKVYEQQENEVNPLRCPVKLYEFYLSKCPESVKTRNDVFYLLPERSCVPDSPVWYSTMLLDRDPLQKMLHRIKMVKEINMALLNS